jgi:hypothetical protein
MNHFACPEEIQEVAWEGNLVAAPTFMKGGPAPAPPFVRINKLEHWPLPGAPEHPTGAPWGPPPSAAGKDANYWLLRLACELRPSGKAVILTEAQLALSLRPSRGEAAEPSLYAYYLHPDREEVESPQFLGFNVAAHTTTLEDGTRVQGANVRAGWEFRKVFPVIESHDVGSADPYWIFRHHATRPLTGSQFVYAVVAAGKGVAAFWAALDLTATMKDTTWASWIRFSLPPEARDRLGFLIPNQGS